MPLAIGKPYLYVDGKKEDVYGAAMLTPEINQEDLVEGRQTAIFAPSCSVQMFLLQLLSVV